MLGNLEHTILALLQHAVQVITIILLGAGIKFLKDIKNSLQKKSESKD